MSDYGKRYVYAVGFVGSICGIASFVGVKVDGISVPAAILLTGAVMAITAFALWLMGWDAVSRRAAESAIPSPPSREDFKRQVMRLLDDPVALEQSFRSLMNGERRLRINTNCHPAHYLALAEECSFATYHLYQEATSKFRNGEISSRVRNPETRDVIANGIDDWVAAAFRSIAEGYPGAAADKDQLVKRLHCAAWRHLTDGNVIDRSEIFVIEPCPQAAEDVTRWVDHENMRR